MVVLAIIATFTSCAMGDQDALEQLLESEETLFVAGGNNSNICTSRDGIVWTGPHYTTAGHILYASVFTPHGFYAAGGDGSYTDVVYSQNGVTWIPMPTNFINPTFTFIPEDIIYTNGAFIMAHHEGILHSYDGSSWREVLNLGAADMYCVAYGNGLYLYAGETAGVYASIDGIHWTNTAGFPNMILYDILFVNDVFYVAGLDNGLGRGLIMTTPDGVHFSGNLLPMDTNGLNGIAHGGGRFVAVANNGKVWVSPNGMSWIPIQPAGGIWSNILEVVYGGGRFVAITATPSVLYSDDGVTWTQAVPPSGGFPNLYTITVRP